MSKEQEMFTMNLEGILPLRGHYRELKMEINIRIIGLRRQRRIKYIT